MWVYFVHDNSSNALVNWLIDKTSKINKTLEISKTLEIGLSAASFISKFFDMAIKY